MARKIRRDIETMMALVSFGLSLSGRRYRGTREMLQRMLEDLETGFLFELNLAAEAQAMQKFRKQMRSNSRVYIPKLYRDLSSKHVLVVEHLKGESLAKFRERAAGDAEATKDFAELALREILTQVFDHGNFHADPHAGNFLVMEDGRLGLIDFGLTGEFTGQDRKKIGKAVKALMARDADSVISALLELRTLQKISGLEV